MKNEIFFIKVLVIKNQYFSEKSLSGVNKGLMINNKYIETKLKKNNNEFVLSMVQIRGANIDHYRQS